MKKLILFSLVVGSLIFGVQPSFSTDRKVDPANFNWTPVVERVDGTPALPNGYMFECTHQGTGQAYNASIEDGGAATYPVASVVSEPGAYACTLTAYEYHVDAEGHDLTAYSSPSNVVDFIISDPSGAPPYVPLAAPVGLAAA